MRLDKYLKVSRLIKRRTVAKDACDHGKISINSRVAKAGTKVAIGDLLEISYGARISRYKVLKLDANAKKDEAATLYETL